MTLRRKLRRYWVQLELEWQLFIEELDYGYSVESAAFLDAVQDGGSVRIDASKGWHRTGMMLKPGETIELQATGRFLIKENDTEKWPCEANGVTIRYYRGQPLGILEAMILPPEPEQLPQAFAVGTKASRKISTAGELMLRINDHPAERDDNSGGLTVRVSR